MTTENCSNATKKKYKLLYHKQRNEIGFVNQPPMAIMETGLPLKRSGCF